MTPDSHNPPAGVSELYAACRKAARRVRQLQEELARMRLDLAAAERRNWNENESLRDVGAWCITASQVSAWQEVERLRLWVPWTAAELAAAERASAAAERALAGRLANVLYAGGRSR